MGQAHHGKNTYLTKSSQGIGHSQISKFVNTRIEREEGETRCGDCSASGQRISGLQCDIQQRFEHPIGHGDQAGRGFVGALEQKQ